MSSSDGYVSIAEEKEAIRDLIQNTAYLLDHEQFVDYMNTFCGHIDVRDGCPQQGDRGQGKRLAAAGQA